MSRLFDVYIIIIVSIILRILIPNDVAYLISCFMAGIAMGVYSGLTK